MHTVSIIALPEWEALRTATDALYETFSSYPLRAVADISRCDHCVTDEDDALLRAKPLRELTAHDLSFVVGNPGTWGEEVDFKHFLPRLFELISLELAGQQTWWDSETLGRRIEHEGNGFMGWPAHERASMTSFCLAWWRAALATWPTKPFVLDDTAETVICSIAQFSDDLMPYLDAWREALESDQSIAPLAHLLVWVCQRVTAPHLGFLGHGINEWMLDRRAQWGQLSEWTYDLDMAAAALHALQRARARHPDADTQLFNAAGRMEVAAAIDWVASWA